MRKTMLVTAATAALIVAPGCGGEDEEEVTAQQAIVEAGEVRRLLDVALGEYERGNGEVAEEQVGDAYLDHFEKIEGPLGERDGELMEEVEELVSSEIRDKMKDEAAPAEVRALVAEAKRGLAEAETKLRQG